MKEIYQYEDLYNRLKDGKEVVPVSRDEVLMMTLINKLGSLGADEGTTEKLQEILDRVMTISANSEERSLKKFLECRSDLSHLFTYSTYLGIESVSEILDYSDTSNVTDMNYMFYNCEQLTEVPLLDTSNVTNMNAMFNNCKQLTEVPLLDTSNVTNMNAMFSNCEQLTEVPLLDTSNVTNMSYMFNNCKQLTEVPLLDTSNVTNMNAMFNNCKQLTTCLIRNIKVNLQVGSGTVYGHLLTVDSLLHLVKELRDTGSTLTLTVGSANLEKLADIYVKTIDITDDMRAEDDLIDEKLPFEVCESTDDGAVLITEYVKNKNWTLK